MPTNPEDPRFRNVNIGPLPGNSQQNPLGGIPGVNQVAGGINAASEVDPGIAGGTNPITGFASRYQPDALRNIWETPWSILPDVFPGMNTSGSGYQSLRDIGADPLTLYNLMSGQRGTMLDESTALGGYTNWLADLYKSMGTKGGRGFSGGELLRNLFNPQEDSALKNILMAGDSTTQMRTLYNMARDASNVGLNPMAATGYQAALARAGDTAINQLMNTNAGGTTNNLNVYELIKRINPSLAP